MLNCLVALTFQIVGATSVLIVYSLRWLLLLKSKDEQNQPSPPLHPGKVHGAPLSRLAHASDRVEHLSRDRTKGRTPERVRVEAMRRTYRETIHRNETLESGETKTLRNQFISRSVILL